MPHATARVIPEKTHVGVTEKGKNSIEKKKKKREKSKHGGGQRCEVAGCRSMARGKTVLCGKHGGGRRCEVASSAGEVRNVLSLRDQGHVSAWSSVGDILFRILAQPPP